MNEKKQKRKPAKPRVPPPEEEDLRVNGGLGIAGNRVLHEMEPRLGHR
jgi:hypothetical protein